MSAFIFRLSQYFDYALQEYEGDSEAADDEVTLDEQEQHETQSDNNELEDLKNEGTV